MTPREIVHELDKYIVGQHAAKRAVAIALRNRWRRMQLEPALRDEVTPKNILMIGPTGVGKTEIARRLATLANAPFIKVEATKFTEVGYVGKDVEPIIRDLADSRGKDGARAGQVAACARRPRIAPKIAFSMRCCRDATASVSPTNRSRTTRATPTRARSCASDCAKANSTTREIELDIAENVGVEIMAPPGMEEMTSQLQRHVLNR